MKFRIFLPLVFSFVLVSCNGKGGNKNLSTKKEEIKSAQKTVRLVNSLRLKSPHRGDLFVQGEAIDVVMNPRKKADRIDSVQLWENEKLVKTRTDEPWFWKWIPEGKKMGKQNLKLMAFHSNGSIGVLNTYINLKPNTAPDNYSFKTVNSFPHDRRAYTQGLFFHNGFLYEGTGQKGESSLRKVKLENGEAVSVLNLEQEYFGEGITFYDGKIIQLTWTSGKAFVIDSETFEKIDSFHPKTSNGQSWGITTMNEELVISDGTNVLSVVDPATFSTTRTIEVYDNDGKVTNLNELEYIEGKIYANVWLTDKIVIIHPETGRVEGNIDLSTILSASEKNKLDRNDDVLNGIAWDTANKRLFVTGKHWPKIFEIKIEKEK